MVESCLLGLCISSINRCTAYFNDAMSQTEVAIAPIVVVIVYTEDETSQTKHAMPHTVVIKTHIEGKVAHVAPAHHVQILQNLT